MSRLHLMSRLLHVLQACGAALSRSGLEDTGAPAPMEIMMTESPEDICLLAYSPQSSGTCGGPGATPSREGEPDPWGHVASPELP
jgi:hypothetical protein